MNFTSAENEALQMFRRRASQITENTDAEFLIRWLRARELDLEKAELMLESGLEWREAENIKRTLQFSASEEVAANIRRRMSGYDSEGRPIFIFPVGSYEIKKFIQRGLRNEVLQHCRRLLEEMSVSIENTEGVTQFVLILDMSGLTFGKLAHLETVNFLMSYFREFEAYYPELLHSCYIINAPRAFTYIFNILKPLLTKRTLGKVKIYDSGPKWRSEINAELPTTSLPTEYRIIPIAVSR